ncbi:MAG: TetR/AcrR family transcriptional regulator [Actinobacteria bacterium]|nr:TetR/AcrR family transcriptional regulator [Actinomycetota bacterium]
MTLRAGSGPQRRRGAALEDALLDAAWGELIEHGYTGFTFEGVAHRAGTSRPVVYRRWASKQELVRAAIKHRGGKETLVLPDTGSLRGDLVALMRQVSDTRSDVMALFTVGLGAYYEETGTTLGRVRADFLSQRNNSTASIFDRAIARGEIEADALTPRIAALPFDLLRHELIMSLQPIDDAAIEEIVDTIFLPLVRSRGQ